MLFVPPEAFEAVFSASHEVFQISLPSWSWSPAPGAPEVILSAFDGSAGGRGERQPAAIAPLNSLLFRIVPLSFLQQTQLFGLFERNNHSKLASVAFCSLRVVAYFLRILASGSFSCENLLSEASLVSSALEPAVWIQQQFSF